MNNLLIPRFKVIADYPLCQFEVGDILSPGKGTVNSFYSAPENNHGINLKDINKYPHLFKKIEKISYDKFLEEMQPNCSLSKQSEKEVDAYFCKNEKGDIYCEYCSCPKLYDCQRTDCK